MAGNWIKGAISKPGALHKEMSVPQGQKIPAAKLAKAATKGGKLGKRARLAETLKGLGGGNPSMPKESSSDVKTSRGNFKIRGS